MSNKKVVVSLVTLGVAAIGVYAMFGRPGTSEDQSGGTIGMAKKYRAEQITQADVSLQDPEVQELIQSDTFYQLITDEQFRRTVTQDFKKVDKQMEALNKALVANVEAEKKRVKNVETPIDLIYRTGEALQKQNVQEALRSDDRVKLEDAARQSNVAVKDLEAMRHSIRGLTPEAQANAIQTWADLGRLKIKHQDIFGRSQVQDALSRVGDNLQMQAVQEALRTGDQVKMAEAAKQAKIDIKDLEMLRQGLEDLPVDGRAQAIADYTEAARLKIKYKELERSDVEAALSRLGDNMQMQAVQEALRTGDQVKMADAAKQAKIDIKDLEMLRQGIKKIPADGHAQAVADYTEAARLRIKYKDLLGRSQIESVLSRVGDKVQMQAVQEALRTGDQVKMAEAAKQSQIDIKDLEMLRQGIKKIPADGHAQAVAAYSDFGRLNVKHKELFGHGVAQDAMSRGGIPKHAEISREFFTSLDNLNRGGALNNPKVREGLARNNVAEAGKNAPAANVKDLEDVARVLKYADAGFQAHFIKDGLGKVGDHVADVRFQDVMGMEAFGKTLQYDGLILRSAVAGVSANGRQALAEMDRIKIK